jgi:hypothetical protein
LHQVIAQEKDAPIPDEAIEAIMNAAVSFGYLDEQLNPRPRRPLSEVTTWL